MHNAVKLRREKASMEWWNLAMLLAFSVTQEGTFDDIKNTYLRDVNPFFLILVQQAASLIFIICLWYILRRLASINEQLDASWHLELQLDALRAAHRQTQDDMAAMRTLIHQMRDTLPAFATLAAYRDEEEGEQ